MSLKSFHVVFIMCSIILVIGFGCWAIDHIRQQQMLAHLWTGIISFILAAGLTVYEYMFLKKTKDLS